MIARFLTVGEELQIRRGKTSPTAVVLGATRRQMNYVFNISTNGHTEK